MEISGKNEYDLIYKYLLFIKHRLAISRNNEVKVLAMMIYTANRINKEKKFKTQKELGAYISKELGLQADIAIPLDSEMPMHSFISTLHALRKVRKKLLGYDANNEPVYQKIHILDTNNVPYLIADLRPVYPFGITKNSKLTIIFNNESE